jgi:hypothetical protein
MSTGPVTSLHYAANGNFVNGVYAPGVDGFNLADVSSASVLNALPANVKGLVYLGMTDGVTSAFISAVNAFLGNSKVYAFYLADEPNPSSVSAANLMAESDYIHQHFPGVKTFIVEYNQTSDTNPTYAFTPANTHIDLFGLDPYPVNTNVPNSLDYQIIPAAVQEALKIGIPLADIVPVYQAFGGGQYSTYILPTPAQEQQILATWASVVPNPAFDYAYSWGTQVGDTALANDPALAAVFAEHNAVQTTSTSTSTSTLTPAPTPSSTTPPSVSFTAAAQVGGATATSAVVTVTGAASDSTGVTGVELFNGSTDLGAATLNADGTWSFTKNLGLGTYALSAVATNAGGLAATAAASFSLTVGADSVTQVVSDNVSTKWTYNTDGSLHDVAYSGLFALPYTSYDVVYGANDKPLSATYSNGMTAAWTYSSTGSIQTVTYNGVTGQPYTSYEVFYNSQGQPTSATYNNGMTAAWAYTSGGALQDVAYTGVTGQPYTSYEVFYGSNGKPTSATYSNGMSAVWTYYSDGAAVETFTGGSGERFKTKTILYDSEGHVVAAAIDLKRGGAGSLQLYASGLTVTQGAGSLTLQAGGHTFSLNAHGSEFITAAPAGGDTIAYHSGFGSSTIYGFQPSGASHDTLQFDASMFSGTTAGSSAADLSAMLLNGSAVQSGANVSITDLTKDTTALASTQLSALSATSLAFV